MKKILAFSSVTSLVALLPVVASAQQLGNVSLLIQAVGNIINILIPILVSIALLVFFWGLILYIRAASDPEEAKKGKSIMIYGIIALFVMVSVWGIVGFIGRALSIGQGGGIPVPTVNNAGSGPTPFQGNTPVFPNP